MKTKSVLKFLVPVAISALLVSCSSNNKVASNFGKRKYTKGFFFDRPTKPDAPARNYSSVLPKSSHAISTSSVTLQNKAVTPVVVMQDKKLSVSTNSTVVSTTKKHSFLSAIKETINTMSGKTAVASSSAPQVGSPSSLDNEGGYHSSGGGGGGDCKNWVVCFILCWLLGYIGVHRYYMGYIWQGVVQTLTLGVCGLWTLIDFIRILMKSLKPKDGDYC